MDNWKSRESIRLMHDVWCMVCMESIPRGWLSLRAPPPPLIQYLLSTPPPLYSLHFSFPIGFRLVKTHFSSTWGQILLRKRDSGPSTKTKCHTEEWTTFTVGFFGRGDTHTNAIGWSFRSRFKVHCWIWDVERHFCPYWHPESRSSTLLR